MGDFKICKQGNRSSRNNGVIRVRDAFVEKITSDNRTGYVTISYGVKGDFDMIHMNLVVLIVSHDTIIQNKSGHNLSFRDLRKGMIIDAEFSTVMTRSVPPQTRAFRITVVNQNRYSKVLVDRVLSVDTRNNFLYTGYANDISSQMRFVITDSTSILNSRGNPIQLRNIRPGQTVRVEHASFQTMSIPPQTTAFFVRVL